MHDIETRADVERLVRAFYSRALTDPIIGWIFTDIAQLDLEAHVPEIASFWETILLGAQSYRGGAFRPHAALHMRVRLREGHFQRWLVLWRETVDELFAALMQELTGTPSRPGAVCTLLGPNRPWRDVLRDHDRKDGFAGPRFLVRVSLLLSR